MTHVKGFIPILLIVVCILGGYFFVYPQWQELGNNRMALKAAQQQNDKLKQSEADLESFLSKYQSLSEEVNMANKALPIDKSELQSVLANLSRFAQSTGVSLSSVAVNESTDKIADNAIAAVDLNMSASGTYSSFIGFLLELENSQRLSDIHLINLSQADSTAQVLQYQIMARVYYQK